MSEITDNNMLNNGVVDTDLKSTSNLLNSSDTVRDIQNQVLTEVTSVAKEEQTTGQQIQIPAVEELYSKAVMSYIRNIKHLNDLVSMREGSGYKISRKGMNRVLNAILQLPMDGLPVTLQGKEEKSAFAFGQRIIADRYLITHHHILEEKKRLQKLAEDSKVAQNNNMQQQVANQEIKNDQV